MKKIILLIITFFLTAQTIKAQAIVLDANGVTVKWTGTSVPSPYLIQASPRGILEWFAIVDNTTRNNITTYAQNILNPNTITYYFRPQGQASPIPFNNIVTTLVTSMSQMFQITGGPINTFNQDISSWDVSNVTDMSAMFQGSRFNQDISFWDVSSVGNMGGMFDTTPFNQPIGSWNVGNANAMGGMFSNTPFNQPIGSWNVGNVTQMIGMFKNATAFNQPIGSWNVGNVTRMDSMFEGAFNVFNQPLSCWNVGNVQNMSKMFCGSFNQNIGSWNVGNVTNMTNMFGRFSIANYDALLMGWSIIGPNETPLRPNVVFTNNTQYCNGASARTSIISTFGWTISDGYLWCTNIGTAGPICQSLDTENFNISSLKLYPNPVLCVLNIKVDSNLINQPYTIIDGLGRVILNGKLNDVDTSINVEQLSKGIYYLKVSDDTASKFIKE